MNGTYGIVGVNLILADLACKVLIPARASHEPELNPTAERVVYAPPVLGHEESSYYLARKRVKNRCVSVVGLRGFDHFAQCIKAALRVDNIAVSVLALPAPAPRGVGWVLNIS